MTHTEDGTSLPLVESARLLGAYRWIEFRLFEVLGSWVAGESDPEARLFFDVHSKHHAWHSELWAERIPTVAGVCDPETVSIAPGPGTEHLLGLLGAESGEHGGGTLLRLVALARVVYPRLVSGYSRHLRAAHEVTDAPVIRALQLTLLDETEAWHTSELVVQGFIRRPHDVEVLTAHQQRLEELVAGVGPGLVDWPGN
jgi:hypothetical protein